MIARKFYISMILLTSLFAGTAASAQQSIVGEVSAKCANELQTYCKGVTIGEGRVAACLYAYEDKLSVSCAVAVYDGVRDFFNATKNLDIYAKQCSSDLVQYCSTVVPGEGRLYECIRKNKATLTDSCRAALAKSAPDMKRLGLSH